jgi:soluble lytic murein transglycosylase-like protein
MSATITLKQSMARSPDAALYLIKHSLMIAGVLLVLGIINVFTNSTQSVEFIKSALPDFSVSAELPEARVEAAPEEIILSPRMQGALDYVARRYRVSSEALLPVFEVAQLIGKERRIDPLLIVAIIGIESRFNPFAESAMGAQGLMQIIPRFHMDKVPEGAGDSPLLDPEINIRVGVLILEEAIQRRGGLIAGLQYYAGSSETEGSYASKVLAEKERLEQAARRNARSSA